MKFTRSADGAPLLNPKGMPYALAFRRILEECKTIEEAEKLLRKTERSTILSLAVCDRQSCGVLEITPKNVVLRRGSDGICVNTNHFRSESLALWKHCPRYAVLSKAAAIEKLDVADVFKKLDEVNLGPLTVQSMVFEPGAACPAPGHGHVPGDEATAGKTGTQAVFPTHSQRVQAAAKLKMPDKTRTSCAIARADPRFYQASREVTYHFLRHPLP